MTRIVKQMTDIEDVLHFIDDMAGYVKMTDKFEVEIKLINRKFRVTISMEAE